MMNIRTISGNSIKALQSDEQKMIMIVHNIAGSL